MQKALQNMMRCNIIFRNHKLERPVYILSYTKKSVCVFFCILFAMAIFSTTAGAITIDGEMKSNLEWKDAVKTVIFPSGTNTNCDINFTCMWMKIDRSNNAVFLAFQVIQKTTDALQPGNTAIGVRLKVADGTNIACRISGIDEFDRTAYSVEKGIIIGSQNDYIIEMRIGYLSGVPENPLLSLQLIDSFGNFSNYYSFPVIVTTTTKPVTTAKPTTTAKPATTKTTTKPVTAAKSTTNATTGAKPGSTSGSQTNGSSNSNNSSGSGYSQGISAVEAVTGENGEPTQTNYSSGENTAEAPGRGTENDFSENGDTNNQSGGIGTNKQIAAVAVAAILIALAVFFIAKAARSKPPVAAKPAVPDMPDEDEDTDDEF